MAILFVALVALGYSVFVFFIKSFSPTAGTLSLLVFAVIAGIATFFSPCSFPLMPGYLTRNLQVTIRDPEKVRASAVSNGVAAAAGVFLFDVILGLVIVLVGFSFAGSLGISGPSPNLCANLPGHSWGFPNPSRNPQP